MKHCRRGRAVKAAGCVIKGGNLTAKFDTGGVVGRSLS